MGRRGDAARPDRNAQLQPTSLGARIVSFGAQPPSINHWRHRNADFCQSLRAGRILADAEVANSLHKRATGFTVEATKILYDKDKGRFTLLVRRVNRLSCTGWHEYLDCAMREAFARLYEG